MVQPMPLQLSDGTRVQIRPVEPADKPRLADALARLSRESVRRRFLAAKPSLSTTELRYLTEVDVRRCPTTSPSSA
jgi:hypothetical protein